MKKKIFFTIIAMIILLFATEVINFEAAALDYEVTDTSVVFTAKGFSVFEYTIELSTGRNIEKNLILFKNMSKVVNISDFLEEEYLEFYNSECSIKNVNVKLVNNVTVKAIIIAVEVLGLFIMAAANNKTHYMSFAMCMLIFIGCFGFGGEIIYTEPAIYVNLETHQFMAEKDMSISLNYEMPENKFAVRCHYAKKYEPEEIPLNVTTVRYQDAKLHSQFSETIINFSGRFLCAIYAIAIYNTIEEKRKRNQKLESTS